MLKRLRQRSRQGVTALVLLMSLVGIPHNTDPFHDIENSIVLVPHDESAHRIVPARTDTDAHPLHCLVCHLMRSFRPRTEVRNLSPAMDRIGARFHTPTFTALSAAPMAQPPLRSPPTSPISA
jgi:hypothetical protein